MASIESLSRALRDDSSDDEEADYELGHREATGREWMSQERLPVRGIDGRVRTADQLAASKDRASALTSGKAIRPFSGMTAASANSSDESEVDSDADSEAAFPRHEREDIKEKVASSRAAGQSEPPTQFSWHRLATSDRARLRHQAKLRIAGLCEALVADPETSVLAPKPPAPDASGEIKRKRKKRKSPIVQLQAFCATDDPVVRSLALASTLAVMQDILPGYRIRPPTQADLEEQKLSKDVRSAWKFERALLDAYESYLSALGSCIELHPSGKGKLRRDAALSFKGAKRPSYRLSYGPKAHRTVALTATKCLCELLQSHQHFNHSELVVKAAVGLGDCGEPELESLAHAAIKEMFSMDPTGYASSEAAEAISKRVKKRGPRVSLGLLDTLGKLRIRRLIADDKAARRKKDYQEDGAGYRRPDNDEVEIALKAMDADERDLRKQANEKALKAAVTALFRLLKHPKGTSVLGPVLNALGRFVHLIDVEVAGDVLAALQDLTDRATLPAVERAIAEGGLSTGEDGAGGETEGTLAEIDAESKKVAAFAAGSSSDLQDDRSGAVLNADELAVVQDGAGEAKARVRRGSKKQRVGRRQHVLLNEQPLGRLPVPITVDPSVAMELVSAAAWIIAGPGSSLGIDSSTFSTFLYRSMMAVPSGGKSAVGSACRAIALQLLKRREPDPQVSASFAKRCLVISMQVDTRSQAALIQLFRQLVGSYTELEQVLDRVQDRVQGGTYYIDGMSLEKCAGLAAPTFELADLAVRSWHPIIRKYAIEALSRAVVSPAHAPVEVIKSASLQIPDAECGFAGVPPAASKDARFADVVTSASASELPSGTLAARSEDDLALYEVDVPGLSAVGKDTLDAIDRLAAGSPSAFFSGSPAYAAAAAACTDQAYWISQEDEDALIDVLEPIVATGASVRQTAAAVSTAGSGARSVDALDIASGSQRPQLGKRKRGSQAISSSPAGTVYTSASSAGTGNPEGGKDRAATARASKARREKARKKRRKEGIQYSAGPPATVDVYKSKLAEKYGKQKHKWSGPVGKLGKAKSSIMAPGVGAIARSALTSDAGKPRRRKASKAERLQQRIAVMKAGRDAMRYGT